MSKDALATLIFYPPLAERSGLFYAGPLADSKSPHSGFLGKVLFVESFLRFNEGLDTPWPLSSTLESIFAVAGDYLSSLGNLSLLIAAFLPRPYSFELSSIS